MHDLLVQQRILATENKETGENIPKTTNLDPVCHFQVFLLAHLRFKVEEVGNIKVDRV